MPITLYRQKEYEAVERLSKAMGLVLSDIAHQQSAILRQIHTKKDKSHTFANGSYPYIPNRLEPVANALNFVYDKLCGNPKDSYKRPSFVDVGCGYPIIVMLANNIGFNAVGYELDDAIIKMSDGLNATIKKQDILSASYRTFDVVYYYCPFENEQLQKELEAKIEFEMKVGAYLLASLKKSGHPNKKKFKQIKTVDSYNDVLIYKKTDE